MPIFLGKTGHFQSPPGGVWGARGRRFKSCRPDLFTRKSLINDISLRDALRLLLMRRTLVQSYQKMQRICSAGRGRLVRVCAAAFR